MADLIFYTNPQSRGRIVRWMLEEVGEPYETEIIPYDRMKSERYLAIHPLGKVPAIKHNGRVLTESAAICAYHADIFPQAGLGPSLREELPQRLDTVVVVQREQHVLKRAQMERFRVDDHAVAVEKHGARA